MTPVLSFALGKQPRIVNSLQPNCVSSTLWHFFVPCQFKSVCEVKTPTVSTGTERGAAGGVFYQNTAIFTFLFLLFKSVIVSKNPGHP